MVEFVALVWAVAIMLISWRSCCPKETLKNIFKSFSPFVDSEIHEMYLRLCAVMAKSHYLHGYYQKTLE